MAAGIISIITNSAAMSKHSWTIRESGHDVGTTDLIYGLRRIIVDSIVSDKEKNTD